MASRKPISKKLRFDVLHRDGFTCQYCGAKPTDGVVLHLDHRLAVAKGGENTLENLLTSCAPCNIGKGVTDLSISAGSVVVVGKEAPRVEFFWHSEWESGVEFITQARVVDRPMKFDGFEYYDGEYYRLCHSTNPRFSTYGASSIHFSAHAAATKVFDLLGCNWRRGRYYIGFLDDLLMMADAGKVPEYIAPMVLRAAHPETYHSRCQQRDRDYEDQLDAIFGQCTAVFNRWLDREANASGAHP